MREQHREGASVTVRVLGSNTGMECDGEGVRKRNGGKTERRRDAERV